MNNRYKVFVFLAIVCLFTGCWGKGKKIPDVSHINIDVNIERFEKALFAIDTNDIKGSMDALKLKYPDFSAVFFGNVLPTISDPEVMKVFLRSGGIRQLYDTTMLVFNDLSVLESDFEQAFKFYNHYFPNRTTPRVISFLSEYSIGAFTYGDNILAVGLDFYLGKDYSRYNPQYFPQFIKRSMDQKHLVAKSMEALVSNVVGDETGNRLLDKMIHNGKAIYILDHLLPHETDSIKLAYTQNQVMWCEQNELQIWTHFLSEELLYSTKSKEIKKLVSHSPNSPNMPAEAPGRTANFIGWQIVKSYMKRYPETTFEELVAIKDPQQLLDKAKYKPR